MLAGGVSVVIYTEAYISERMQATCPLIPTNKNMKVVEVFYFVEIKDISTLNWCIKKITWMQKIKCFTLGEDPQTPRFICVEMEPTPLYICKINPI